MRRLRALQGLELALNIKRAGNHDDRHVRSDSLESRQELGASLAVGQDVVENNQIGSALARGRKRGRSVDDAGQPVTTQRFGIKPKLRRIILDHQDAGHGRGIHVNRSETNLKTESWELCV